MIQRSLEHLRLSGVIDTLSQDGNQSYTSVMNYLKLQYFYWMKKVSFFLSFFSIRF